MEFLAGNRIRGLNTEKTSTTTTDITWDSTTAINVSISGNTVTGTGTGAWDKVARSTQTWTPSDAPTLDFTSAGTGSLMAGFGKGTLGTNHTTIDFALYSSDRVWENGSQVFSNSTVPSSSDTLKITMDSNGLVKYWVNGAVIYTSTQTASGTYYAQFATASVGKSATMTFALSSPINTVDGSIFYATDTNKSYVLYNGSWTEL
mgnify:CR=1